jgi:selenophosphate synthetase-related protein
MNDSMTVVATKTRTVGRLLSIEVLMSQVRMANTIHIIDDSTAIRRRDAAAMINARGFYESFINFL